MRIRGSATTIALIGVGLGACLAGGVAVAAHKSSKSLTACTSKSGVLSLASAKGRCASGTTKVAIDQRGPRGKSGASHAYGVNRVEISIPTSFQDESASLPTISAGSYAGVLTVNSDPFHVPAAIYDVDCVADAGNNEVGQAEGRFFPDGYGPGQLTIPLAFTSTTAAPLTLSCKAGGDVYAYLSVELTRVNALN